MPPTEQQQQQAGAAAGTGPAASGFNPAKVDAKVYLANERTLLTWMRQAVLLGGLGAAACGFASYHHLRGSDGGGHGGSDGGHGGSHGGGSAAAACSQRDLDSPQAAETGGSGGRGSGSDHGAGAAAACSSLAAAGKVLVMEVVGAAARVSPQELLSRLGGMALMLLGAGVAAAACRNYYLRVDMIRSGVGSDSSRWDSKVLPRLLTGCLAAVMLAVFAGSLQAAMSR